MTKLPGLLQILFLCFISASLFSQKLKIEGVVKDSTGTGLEMANIVALDAKDSSMTSYAFSNNEGKFQLSLPVATAYILRVSYLGYEPKDELIKPEPGKEKIYREVILRTANNMLNEAQVVEEMPIAISGDTIIYKAEAFTTGEERKLGDVLEELPGFEVDDNGEVKVQGKKVEKVMVEGKDFFDGDTKLATKNIPANAVDKVQVLRNYNDVAPMRGVENEDRIALNIKLKEGKKNIFFGDISAEGGLDERYLLHPNIFYYNPRISVNFIGDINNIGQPAFTFQDYFRFSGGFKNLASKSGSFFQFGRDDLNFSLVSDNRARELTTRFGAFNFSYNPAKKWTISGFFIGSLTKTLTSSVTTRNYLNIDTLKLDETLTANGVQENKAGLFKLSSTYTPNTSLHIGYDALVKVSDITDEDNRLSDFGFLSDNITTNNHQKPASVQQNLEAYYELDDHNLLSLEAQYLYKDQDPVFLLSTGRDPFFGYIPFQDTTPYRLLQDKSITTSKLDASFNYYYIFNKKNHINLTLGGSFTDQALRSQLTELLEDGGESILDSSQFGNDVRYSVDDAFASLHYKVMAGMFEISPGINYHYYHLYDLQRGTENSDNRHFLLPDLYVKMNLKKSEKLTLTYAMQAQFTDVSNVSEGTIVSSYNTLFQGNRLLDNALIHSVQLGYYNFNLFNFTNIFGGINYSRKAKDITNTIVYQGLGRISRPINSEGLNDVLSGFGSYEKRFGKLKAGVNATLAFTNISNKINAQENESRSFTQNYSASFGTNFKEAPNVKLSYNWLTNTYTGANVSSTFITQKPAIEVDAVILKDFTFTADYTYNFYKSQDGNTRSEYDFLNATLYYRKGKSPWEFKISGLNILNTDIIRQDAFTDFFVSSTRYDVLPRYIMLGVKYDL